jgi:glycosyltransferase involved in cell wall biosynthesis
VKINYISFLHPNYFSGGGEAVGKTLIDWAQNNLGVEVFFCTRKPLLDNYQQDADFNIIIDFFNLPTSWRKQNVKKLYNRIASKPFIHFDNSYVDLCNLDYLPCNGDVSLTCKFKKNGNYIEKFKRLDFSNKCSVFKRIRSDLYLKSNLNVFVSPLHQSKIEKMLNMTSERSFVLRPLINTDKFRNTNDERDIDYLYVGSINDAKGLSNLKDMFSGTGKKLTMIGANNSGGDLDFAEHLGFKAYEKLPKYYNRAKNFVHLPRWPEPQGRTLTEAALCGCNLITNENVGATSFNFDLSNPKNLENVESEFWEKVIDATQRN